MSRLSWKIIVIGVEDVGLTLSLSIILNLAFNLIEVWGLKVNY
jgi:hypothetical protein